MWGYLDHMTPETPPPHPKNHHHTITTITTTITTIPPTFVFLFLSQKIPPPN
jgi:hypothetical protein